MKRIAYIIMGTLPALVGMTSCGDDILDTKYTAALDAEEAGEAASSNPNVFLNGMWSYMIEYQGSHDSFGFMSTIHSKDMMTEDIAISANHFFQYDYELDNRMETYRRPQADWLFFYTMVSKANEIISSYPNGVTTVNEKGLVGQAYAIRGWAYYYLIQIFQNPTAADGTIDKNAPGVPLMYVSCEGKSDSEIAASKGRNTVGKVMTQIESDLTTAVKYLGEGYERPNKDYIDVNVANGILARYYLLAKEWQKAADAAALARKGYSIMSETDVFDGFMKISNKEWMWGFDHNTETQTSYASFFSHISNLAKGYAGLGYSSRLIDARLYSMIPETDVRKALFNSDKGDATQPTTGSKKPYASLKFGNTGDWTMDYVYMRASEMVLIEAEANARLGNEAKAAEILGELMSNRQSDWQKTTIDVEEILVQRRIELWGEGFAYFDLKRLNRGIERNYEGSNHLAGRKFEVPARDVKWTYRIPVNEIQENKLINESDQND